MRKQITVLGNSHVYQTENKWFFFQGGLQDNIIPDQLTAVFDIRHSINQNLEEFEEIINKWCKEAGPNVTIEYKQKDSLGGVTAVDKTNPFWVAFKSATDKL